MSDLPVPEELPDDLNPCPQCEERPDGGSVRWNGFAWEHKSSEAHPQAGHHIMDPDFGEDADADAAAAHDPDHLIDVAAEQFGVDLNQAFTTEDPHPESDRVYIFEDLGSRGYRLIHFGMDADGQYAEPAAPIHIPPSAAGVVLDLFHDAGIPGVKHNRQPNARVLPPEDMDVDGDGDL